MISYFKLMLTLFTCFFWGGFFIFSQFSMTEYLSPERALSVRVSVFVSVGVSVCLSVRVSNSHKFRPILMKLGPHDHSKNLR